MERLYFCLTKQSTRRRIDFSGQQEWLPVRVAYIMH